MFAPWDGIDGAADERDHGKEGLLVGADGNGLRKKKAIECEGQACCVDHNEELNEKQCHRWGWKMRLGAQWRRTPFLTRVNLKIFLCQRFQITE